MSCKNCGERCDYCDDSREDEFPTLERQHAIVLAQVKQFENHSSLCGQRVVLKLTALELVELLGWLINKASRIEGK